MTVLPRWLSSYATLSIPQAAAPIAFSLLALPLTGSAGSGAAMVLAMTTAQVLGAVPVTRAGTRLDPISYLRLLVLLRSLALGLVAVLAATGAPLGGLVAAAGAAGLVNGAAYGYQRAALNQLVPASALPRALGLAATVNEVVFVLCPALASAVGAFSPVVAVAMMAVLGAAPIVLIPRPQGARPVAAPAPSASAARRGLPITPMIALWLLCAMASAAAVASIETGAVTLALSLDLGAGAAAVFPICLCLASGTGGLVVSLRNRTPRRRGVLAMLGMMTLGITTVGVGGSVTTTVLGATMIGSCLAPLATYYSLVLDELAPAGRRAEVFALLRTASALGIILASGLLTVASLRATLATTAVLMATAGTIAGIVFVRQRRPIRVTPVEDVPTDTGSIRALVTQP